MTRAFDISWDDSPLIETENKIVCALADAAKGVALCVQGRCYSPIACGGFGYCRARHALPPTSPLYVDPTPASTSALAAKLGTALADGDGSVCEQVNNSVSTPQMMKRGAENDEQAEGERE